MISHSPVSQEPAWDMPAWLLSACSDLSWGGSGNCGWQEWLTWGVLSAGSLSLVPLRRAGCAEGLLDFQVWHLAQVAGTAEAGQSSFLVARLSFLWDGWLPHIASTPKDRRWKLCFSYRKQLSVASATFCWLKQS